MDRHLEGGQSRLPDTALTIDVLDRLAALNRVARSVAGSLDLSQFSRRLADVIGQILPCDGLAVVSHNENLGGTVVRAWALNEGEPRALEWSEPEKSTAIGLQDVIPPDASATRFGAEELDRVAPFVGMPPEADLVPSEAFVAPMLVEDRPIGVLMAASTAGGEWTEDQLALFGEIARQSAPAMEAARLGDELQHSRARMQAMLDALPDLVFRQRADGTYLDYYAPDSSLLAIPPGRIVGVNIRDVGFPPEFVDRVMRTVAEALSTGELQTLEYDLEVRRGRGRFEARIVRCAADEALCVVRDISERTRAESALADRERYLRALSRADQLLLSAWPDLPLGEFMSVVGDVCRSRRAFLVRNYRGSDGRLRMRGRMTWSAEAGLDPDGVGVPEVVYDDVCPRWRALMEGGNLVCGRASEFPDEEREFLAAFRCDALMALPLIVGGEFEGFLAFADPEDASAWDLSGIEFLRAAAADLSQALERRRAETALRESERLHRQTVEIADGVPYRVLYGGDDKEPTYEFMGEGIHRLLGIGADEITPARLNEMVERAKVTLPGAETDRLDVREAYMSGEIDRFHSDLEVRTVDGRRRWISDSAVPLVDPATGKVVGSVGILQDVTDRKKIEESLRKYALIYESMQDAVIVSTPDGITVDINPAAERLYGYRSEEMTGCTAEMLNPPGVGERLTREIIAGLESDGTWRGEIPLVTRSGDQRLIYTVMSCLRDENGEWIGNIGISRDVTDARRSEDSRLEFERQMQQTQKLESLGVLAGGVAHDFNNLLTGILGNASFALADLAGDSPLRESLELIETSARRAAELTRQMLTYSGGDQLLTEPLDLNAIVREMAFLLDASISKRAILNYDLVSRLPAVEADATKLRQVVMNLIINASDAIGDDDGVISVRSGVTDCDAAILRRSYLGGELPPGRYVFFEVCDTGCGFDEETRRRMFDPFFTTKARGRGLGLAAVLGIVRSHHGALEVTGRPGAGATFRILLPAGEAVPGTQPITPASLREPAERAGGTVLVIDDEQTVRIFARRALEKAGYRVLTANDGADGLDTFVANRSTIVAIVLDMTMPRMDGRRVHRELRKRGENVPVLFSSGYSEQQVARGGDPADASAFIQKPYTVAGLVAAIDALLGA